MALRNFNHFRFLGFGFLFVSFLFARLHHFGTVSEHSRCSRPPQSRRGGGLCKLTHSPLDNPSVERFPVPDFEAARKFAGLHLCVFYKLCGSGLCCYHDVHACEVVLKHRKDFTSDSRFAGGLFWMDYGKICAFCASQFNSNMISWVPRPGLARGGQCTR